MNITLTEALAICQQLERVYSAGITSIEHYSLDWMTDERLIFSKNKVGWGYPDPDTQIMLYSYFKIVLDSSDSLKVEFYNTCGNIVHVWDLKIDPLN